MKREASSATYLQPGRLSPVLVWKRVLSQEPSPFMATKEKKEEFPCKGYQEYKCLFNKLFFEMPFPFW